MGVIRINTRNLDTTRRGRTRPGYHLIRLAQSFSSVGGMPTTTVTTSALALALAFGLALALALVVVTAALDFGVALGIVHISVAFAVVLVVVASTILVTVLSAVVIVAFAVVVVVAFAVVVVVVVVVVGVGVGVVVGVGIVVGVGVVVGIGVVVGVGVVVVVVVVGVVIVVTIASTIVVVAATVNSGCINAIVEAAVLGDCNIYGLMVSACVHGAETVNASGKTGSQVGRKNAILVLVVQALEEGKHLRIWDRGAIERGDLLDGDVAMCHNDAVIDLLRGTEVVLLGIDEIT